MDRREEGEKEGQSLGNILPRGSQAIRQILKTHDWFEEGDMEEEEMR